jgi:phosphatidylinositol alpha 1,6-mannosyltransferase
VVGYVGRLAPEKCIDDLRVLHNTPGIRLVIVGDGPERARLERLLPGAAFIGFLQGQDLSRAVATFDIGVHTGPHETFCQSLQEVLASGVPAVAVGAGGPLDLVESSRNGWLYAPGDLDELRERVIDLAGDVAKCRAMGRRAREGVETRTWESVGDQLIAHYRRLTGVADESLRTVA